MTQQTQEKLLEVAEDLLRAAEAQESVTDKRLRYVEVQLSRREIWLLRELVEQAWREEEKI